MRRAAAAVALLWGATALAFAVPPVPPRFFYDGTGSISATDRYQIEARLMELDREGVQIGVAVLSSLDGESVEDATMRIAEVWKPGHAGRDDGALIAVFMNDRKMRIEVGYGLEAKIPDAKARRIVQEEMRPAFQNRQFADGIKRAIEAIAAPALGRQPPPPAATAYPSSRRRNVNFGTGSGCGAACPCLIVLLVAWLFGSLRRATRPRGYGWGRGRHYQSGGLPWWAWLLIGNATSRRGHGWGSGGSSWGGRSGGSWGGGGGGSFGGGSFGGGGASGSW